MKKVFSILLTLLSFQAIAAEAPKTFDKFKEQLELLKPQETDIYIGTPDSSVIMVEYSSLSCPHCKVYHHEVFNVLDDKYFVDGKVQYILRDFPLNTAALQASKLSHCASSERYYDFINTFFEWQDKWAYNREYADTLKKIAKLGGFSDQDYDKCIANKELEDFILKRAMDATTILGVNSTPTVFINGVKYEGDKPYAFYEKIIEEELAKFPPKPPKAAEPVKATEPAPAKAKK